MIEVYYRSGCSSSQKTLNWCQNYGIEFKKHINQICKEDIKKTLSLSSFGMEEILRRPNRATLATKKNLHYSKK
ncbi:hypothetical protein [Lactococcus sp. DD01]|uniref:hypothetical protein n=1 Tax=Lactococcus sp. DD01 TaxID=1776443 RepID=UPI000776171A|nr:hypothetical protein [Lactococcus sp. DD01]